MTDEKTLLTIAVLGGTGKEGSGLAKRWALAGYSVIIGSRDAERARARAGEMNAEIGGDYLSGASNADAAALADVVVLSVPYAAHKDTLQGVKNEVAGKVLVDLTVPLQPPQVRTVHLPEGKAAALEAQALLGDSVRVVAAFQNVSAGELNDPAHIVDCDVLVCGDKAEDKSLVIKLVEAVGMRGIDAGPLANAVAVESLTPVLLYINRAYGIKGAGIRITGLP
ncbi:MAG: NADPH-dependent F420 reductase [Chloroflexi bacterium]|nr:NADPH-dependent F420 reductase [Chloroflexota bacterium]MDL1884570.1 NADPH-dependent F420 reductase [Anaerolineae bacterium CFX8]